MRSLFGWFRRPTAAPGVNAELAAFSDLLGSCAAPGALLERCLSLAVSATGAASGSAWTREGDTPGFRYVSSLGSALPPLPAVLPDVVGRWLSWLGGTSEGRMPEPALPDPPNDVLRAIAPLGARLVVPLRSETDAEGALLIAAPSDGARSAEYGPQLARLGLRLGAVAGQMNRGASYADHVGRVKPLTYFRARLDEELARAERAQRELGLMVVRPGPTGEGPAANGAQVARNVSRTVAGWVAEQVRRMDVVGMGPGGEVLVLLPETGPDEAEKARARLEGNAGAGLALAEGGRIGLSMGIATYPRDALSAQFLLHAAGLRLKAVGGRLETGRTRPLPVEEVVAPPPPPPTGEHRPPRGDGSGEVAVAVSARMREVLETASRFASTKLPVLVQGETGSGKEYLCEHLHRASDRRDQPLVKLNCGAIPENLIESELFGYEKGAFTGAARQTRGKFEAAHGGTLFLDEVADLTPMTQVKLLRSIEQQSFYRVGGTRLIEADVRIIAATNRDLAQEVAAGRFREDLYYRLQGVVITIPPLRDRPEDIPALVDVMMDRFRRENMRSLRGITPDALDLLFEYRWPGNLRELRSVVERACALTRSEYVTRSAVVAALPNVQPPAPPPDVVRPTKVTGTWDRQERVLEFLRGHPDASARQMSLHLGISKSTIMRSLEDLLRRGVVVRDGKGKRSTYRIQGGAAWNPLGSGGGAASPPATGGRPVA
jgi:GGDEF domain-containing protein/DNA-binding transcriptional ArsR family regulator